MSPAFSYVSFDPRDDPDFQPVYQPVAPPDELVKLQHDLKVIGGLKVPTEVSARTVWPMSKRDTRALSRPATVGSMGGFSEGGASFGAPPTPPETASLGATGGLADEVFAPPMRLGTPLRPSSVASAYSSSFSLRPGRPPTAPLSLASTEEAEEAEYAAMMLKSASMPYLYRPPSALPRTPPVRYVREVEDYVYELGMVDQLPNYERDSAGSNYDVAGSNVFDLNAVLGPKPGKGVRRPRTFRVAEDVETPR